MSLWYNDTDMYRAQEERGRRMQVSEYYETDVLTYFVGKPEEMGLYRHLAGQMDRRIAPLRVKVQKSQISFYGKHLFGAVSLPVRRKKEWPAQCLLVTFGLGHRLECDRIAVAVEPYPNRWTHHVVVSKPEQIDAQLLGWLEEAYLCAERK